MFFFKKQPPQRTTQYSSIWVNDNPEGGKAPHVVIERVYESEGRGKRPDSFQSTDAYRHDDVPTLKEVVKMMYAQKQELCGENQNEKK